MTLQFHWKICRDIRLFAAVLSAVVMAAALNAQQAPQLTIHWDKTTVISKSAPTLQVVVNPPLRPRSDLEAVKAAVHGGLLLFLCWHQKVCLKLEWFRQFRCKH